MPIYEPEIYIDDLVPDMKVNFDPDIKELSGTDLADSLLNLRQALLEAYVQTIEPAEVIEKILLADYDKVDVVEDGAIVTVVTRLDNEVKEWNSYEGATAKAKKLFISYADKNGPACVRAT